jgi:hypothetical protein
VETPLSRCIGLGQYGRFRPIGAGIGALTFVFSDYELVLAASRLGFIALAVVIVCSPAGRTDALTSLNTIPLAVK